MGLSITDIKNRLSQVERDFDITVLYACESGSRAWGFESKDSDYDIRFLYVRNSTDYIAVETPRDVIEVPGDELWDMNGWDLSKALKLLVKGNTNLLEWIRSPIVYIENDDLCQELLTLAKVTVSPEKLFYTYQGMARGNYREYLRGEEVWIKKYLYVLRPLVSAFWIEKKGELPPMRLEPMIALAGEEFPQIISPTESLLLMKRNGLERETGPRMPALDNFIEEMLVKRYVGKQVRTSISQELLNNIFRKYVLKNSNQISKGLAG